MRRVLFIIAVLIGNLILVNGQPGGNGLLWEISGNGLEKSSYLFGTFHMLCPDNLVLDDRVKEAITASSQLVLELDFDDPGVMAAVQQGMVFKDTTSASVYMSPEEYKLVADFFTSRLNLPFEQLDRIKPFYLAAITMMFALDCQPQSLELKLTGLASENNLDVIGIETVEEQLGMIDHIPIEDQKIMLLEGIEDPEEMKEMAGLLVDTYLNGDLNGLQNIIDRYMSEEYTHLNEDLIISRNRAWVPKIEVMITGTPSFIAIGAGHLSGKDGLIKLLEKSGYSVEVIQ